MNVEVNSRIAALTGLTLAGCAAAWWLGGSRLAIDRGGNPARVAAEALHLLLVLRAAVTCVLGMRVGALAGWRTGTGVGLCLIAPSWPIVLLAASASTAPLSRVLLGEVSLLIASVLAPLLGAGLRHALGRAEPALVAATAAGIASAGACIALGVRGPSVY